jgi:hypothetical protein
MLGSNPSADSGAETGPRAEQALGGFVLDNRDRHEAVNPGGFGGGAPVQGALSSFLSSGCWFFLACSIR